MGATQLGSRQVVGLITRSILPITDQTITAEEAPLVDHVYICSGTNQITIPTAVGKKGMYIFKNISGSTTLVPSGSETIDYSTSVIVPLLVSLVLVSDGINWYLI